MAKPLEQLVAQPDTLYLLKLDLKVTAESVQMHLQTCTFTVSLSPGLIQLIQPPATINVPIFLMDIYGNMTSVVLPMSSKGDTVTHTATVPIADQSVLPFPDPGRTIFVVADPLNSLSERNEGNNWAKAYCYTLG